MPIRRTLIFYAVVVIAAPIAWFYLQANPGAVGGGGAPGGGGGGNTPAFQYHVVQRGEVISVVSAVGEIEADEIVDMSFTVPGRVSEVFVSEMDYVEAGDLLMRVENDDQRIAYDQAVLNLEIAEIDLADLTGPPDADEVRIAEANVEAAEESLRGAGSPANAGEIAAADLQVEQAEAALDAAIERRVYGGDFEYEEQVDLADAQIGEATFNLEIARLRSQDLRSGDWASAEAARASLVQAEAELARVLAGPTDLAVEQQQARVDQAMAQLDSAELALSKTEIRAPFDGFVGEVLVEPGALVQPGVPVAVMVDVDPLSVTVQVDEIDIGQIEPGMPVRVEVDALPNEALDAELEKIALTGAQTAGGIVNYDAEVELEETNPLVRVGMTAEANIIVAQETDVIVVPNSYIRLDRRANEAFVQVVGEDNEIEERQISLGLRGEDFSEVTDGLEVDDIIAADLSGNQLSVFGG